MVIGVILAAGPGCLMECPTLFEAGCGANKNKKGSRFFLGKGVPSLLIAPGRRSSSLLFAPYYRAQLLLIAPSALRIAPFHSFSHLIEFPASKCFSESCPLEPRQRSFPSSPLNRSHSVICKQSH